MELKKGCKEITKISKKVIKKEQHVLHHFHSLPFLPSSTPSETVRARTDASMRLKSVSQDTQQILDEFNRTYKEADKKEEEGVRVADKFNAVSL